MKTIHIRIEGVTPLLMHRFTDKAAMAATSGTRANIATDHLSPQETAEQSLYKNDAGQIIIPQPNIFRCLIDAGKFFKAGKSKVTTQKSSLIPAALEMNETYYLLESKAGWTVDTRPVRIPSTGGRILCHRPCFNDWAINVEVVLDETMITERTLREIVDAAGRKIGLGDYRPDCKGPFGKFVVTQWAVAEMKAAA